jgi:hypothetical protein
MRFVRAFTVLAMLGFALGASTAHGTTDTALEAGFGARAITPVGTPPAEWAQYLTPQPKTGVWGEPFEDLNGDGCISGLTNNNLEPVLEGEPPRGENPEPHIDQPWNSAGDADRIGAFSVRGVTIVGDPQSTGKWDGLWANAGFGSRCTEGAHDDTWARAVVLRAGGKTVAMVSLDVVGFFNLEVQRARAELKARYPQDAVDELMVSSTHTHEGVDTMGYWGQLYLNTDGKFPAYQAFIRSQILDAVHQAYTGMEPASVRFGVGHYNTAIRDSRPPQVIDDEVVAAQFVRNDGSTIGSLVNWSNHPESMGSDNPLVSSDFAHGARAVLEQDLGGTAVYFSGSVGGLMTPLGRDIPGFGTSPSWGRTFEIGRQVALEAERALADQPVVRPATLQTNRRAFYMDMDNGALRALNVAGIFDIPTFIGGESWGAAANRRDGVPVGKNGPQVQTEMVSLQIGPAVFLTVPGELTPELEIGGFGRPDCPAANTGRPYEQPINSSFTQQYRFVLGLGMDELGYIIPGYDFHITSAGEHPDGRGVVPVGAVEAETCGEGHYEETVSGSSVMAPWVTCIAAELAGKDPWSHPSCSQENTHTLPYGIDPVG